MIPTLEKRYEKIKLRESQLRNQPQLFLEDLSEKDIKEMASLLNQLESVFQGLDLPEIEKGLDRAANSLSKSLGSRGFFGKGSPFKQLGTTKTMTFLTGMVKGLKQIPELQSIVGKIKSDIDQGLDAQGKKIQQSKPENPKTFNDNMNAKQQKRMRAMLLNAFSPPTFLGMFVGLPYVDDNKMIEEIMELSVSDLQVLIQNAQKIKLEVPVEKEDAQQAARQAKRVQAQQKGNPDELEKGKKSSATPADDDVDDDEESDIEAERYGRAMRVLTNMFGKKSNPKQIEAIVDRLADGGVFK